MPFALPESDDYRIVDRSSKTSVDHTLTRFVLLGPTDSVVGQSFPTRAAAEERGIAVAEHARVSLWFEDTDGTPHLVKSFRS